MPQTEFEYELDLGSRSMTVHVEYECSIYTEKNYGADADGNRGVSKEFIEDETVFITDAYGRDITSKIENNYPVEYNNIIEKGVHSL